MGRLSALSLAGSVRSIVACAIIALPNFASDHFCNSCENIATIDHMRENWNARNSSAGILAVQDLFVTVKKNVRMTTALLSVAYEYRGQRPLREVKRERG
jgi:hypothetical protein